MQILWRSLSLQTTLKHIAKQKRKKFKVTTDKTIF